MACDFTNSHIYIAAGSPGGGAYPIGRFPLAGGSGSTLTKPSEPSLSYQFVSGLACEPAPLCYRAQRCRLLALPGCRWCGSSSPLCLPLHMPPFVTPAADGPGHRQLDKQGESQGASAPALPPSTAATPAASWPQLPRPHPAHCVPSCPPPSFATQLYGYFDVSNNNGKWVYYSTPSGTTPTTFTTTLPYGNFYLFTNGTAYSGRKKLPTSSLTDPPQHYIFDWQFAPSGLAATDDGAYVSIADQGAVTLMQKATFPSLYGWSSQTVASGLNNPGAICGVTATHVFLLTGKGGTFNTQTAVTKISLADGTAEDVVTGLTDATACSFDIGGSGDVIVAVGNAVRVLPGGAAPLSSARRFFANGALLTSVVGRTSDDAYIASLAGEYEYVDCEYLPLRAGGSCAALQLAGRPNPCLALAVPLMICGPRRSLLTNAVVFVHVRTPQVGLSSVSIPVLQGSAT